MSYFVTQAMWGPMKVCENRGFWEISKKDVPGRKVRVIPTRMHSGPSHKLEIKPKTRYRCPPHSPSLLFRTSLPQVWPSDQQQGHPPGSLSDMQNLRPHFRTNKSNLQFNKIPRWYLCLLKSEKRWLRRQRQESFWLCSPQGFPRWCRKGWKLDNHPGV